MKEEAYEKAWIKGFTVALFVVLLGLGVRLGYFHLGNHSLVKKNDYTQILPGERGRIFDGSGNPVQMAVTLPAWRFYADRRNGFKASHTNEKAQARIMTRVAEVLEVPRETVESAFAVSTNKLWNRTLGVSRDPDVYDALMRDSKHISGIRVQEITPRFYPQGRLMSHVIGCLYMDRGVTGIEKKYEDDLKGTDGLRRVKLDGRYKMDKIERKIPDKDHGYIPPIHGSDIYLTLDSNIQYYVETALKETFEKFNAQSAWAIVQDVKTGAILAMAVYPDFDPNAVKPSDKLHNNAISTQYEPGSVMKTITLAAALNERLATPDRPIDVGYGPFVYAGTTLKNNANGIISVARGFKISNNVVFAKLGLELQPQRIDTYMRDFGFGEQLEIELPGEARGIFQLPWKEWDKVKPTRVPIGQGIAVTALQMINAYSTIANGGTRMRPYLVKRIIKSTGEVYHFEPEEIGHPVRPEVAQTVRDLMIDVTEEGTGLKARVPGYTVAGKTGTAQRWDPSLGPIGADGSPRGAYSTTDYYASFVGFVPAHDPVFSVLVTVYRAQPVYTGGAVAAPAFSQIAAATARYLEVPPDDFSNEQETVTRSAKVRTR